ncbi:hypothetical protein [Roseibium sp. MMSF_3412]|uniref:hypothetical protein n=1 Tax=Roseibium sp. MMSF_3412 TaxID=3046712 RepID=UPI00273F4B1B|nr:hypothetical protein [Roseibium sp. MMSF_3412]
MRNDVKYFLGQMRNIKAPGLGTKQIDRSLTIEDFDNICVRYSTVGRLVSRQIDLTVDAKDLIEYLANRIETRGAKTKYELYKVERWCRAQLESNTPILQDTTKVQAALINAACDWQGKVDAQPAGPDQVRPIVIELMREYKIEK